ncbi:hypothetical protein CspeluHIS016_0204340 [Cutaneotrichosporon spelunceum]|uniref:DUF7721 domain-containing protein n=1 Tax=Cutaneotrichosporon spelunceum TaxID=1672016 RepID=A0AAD3TR34_9TREE|nr:hypothetical protein CspeluHIS016_0204340 [Cutaneotrichosporon spelunceum]
MHSSRSNDNLQGQDAQRVGRGFTEYEGTGYDFKAVLAGANMQNGNPHDLQKPMASVIPRIQEVQKPDAEIDESAAAEVHNTVYPKGRAQYEKAGELTTEGIGAAATIEALLTFARGGARLAQEGPGHQSLISKLLGMAMSEAVRLYDKGGGTADNGSAADVMTAAGQATLKLLIQNQVQGALGGDYNNSVYGSNAGQILNLAAKFKT